MICRVCLEDDGMPLDIFDTNGEQLNIAAIIQKHLWFKPLPNDSISTVICRCCWFKVNEFHLFYVTVERAHNILANLSVNDRLVKSECMEIEKTSILTEEAIEVKKEMFENVEEVLFTDISECSKIFESELAQDMDTKFASANDIREDKLHIESEHGHDISEEENRIKKSSAKEVVRKSRICKNKKEITKKSTSGTKVKRSGRQTSKPHDEEIIKKYISMGCDLCPFVGTDFIEITAHFDAKHKPQRAYVRCCGRKLDKRFLLVQHAYKHEDPEYFKCTECQKVFANGDVLRSHMGTAHASEEDLIYECDQCPRKFARQYMLKLHKPSHIPIEERQFVCSKCPHKKAFASDHLLQIHVSMRHNKETNVCHVCAKTIRDNQAFEKHVRLHFEDSGPRLKCPRPNCDSWLKDKDNLKEHLRRHNDEGTIFTCKECEKVCKNRRSLTNHLRYAHTNELFTCEECKKTFKKALTLKEHMAQHTGEKLYKCPFCTRTFNSNANMHSHKKKMHPVEWDIWRKTKRGSSQKLINQSIFDNRC